MAATVFWEEVTIMLYFSWIFHICCLVFQRRYDGANSGFEQVPDTSTYRNEAGVASVHVHQQNGLVVNKSGYLYIYSSNETPNIDVFFDNLQVTHMKGPLLEETHYYPFGLTMAGISSRAAGRVENKIKFQEQEFASSEFSDAAAIFLMQII